MLRVLIVLPNTWLDRCARAAKCKPCSVAKSYFFAMGCSSGKPQRQMPAFKADIKSEGQLAGQHGFDLESAKKHIDVYEATTGETQPDAVASQ